MKLSDVNTTDIRDAILLGCRTMSSVFNADDNDTPFFGAYLRPEAYLSFSQNWSDAHVPGRHLNALLNAEDAVGVSLDEDAVEKHARTAFRSYGGPVALPLNRSKIDGPLDKFLPHSIREGFHALHALARYRDSAEAMRTAEAGIETIFRYWDTETGWDYDYLERVLELNAPRALSNFIGSLARSIGPLVKYYRATGYGPALELAIVLKDKAIGEFFTEGGEYDLAEFGAHVHSVTCTMSSLAQLADLTTDSSLMERVKIFYDNGLRELRDELGWSIEGMNPADNPDKGEMNNTGDILETALILGRWGYTECYHDAERILRCHLLPSQLRDISFAAEPANPKGVDGKRNPVHRQRGAFGFPAPYGHQPIGLDVISFNLDIVGGAVGSLCEAYREAARHDEAGRWVNLLFDHETPDIAIESPYAHSALRVRLKRPGPLFVRVPPWVEVEQIRVQGVDAPPRPANGYLMFSQPPVNRTISLEFPLSPQEVTLNHRTREIRTRLRGDEVVAMDNFGADLTFFDPID